MRFLLFFCVFCIETGETVFLSLKNIFVAEKKQGFVRKFI